MERRAKLPALPPIHCTECGANLRVTRSDMRYCSPRCRVRAHRQRNR
jgi:predicted nucleic acid-binding Zn ribbon protein